MADLPSRKVALLPPKESTGLKISDPVRTAGGFTAIASVFKHISREMGIIHGVRGLAHLNQKKGFDCPSCAWPDPERRSSIGEFCENGAKALAEEATRFRVDREFFARHSVEELSLKSDFWLGKQGRITEPFFLPAGSSHYQPISWPDAFSMVAEALKALASPDQAIFYTSGRTSNEAAFMYQLLVRQYGTNNLPDCSNMCHESSGVGLKETLGIGKGSVTLEDIHQAQVIVVIGQNPGTNHPRMLTALKKCKKDGGKIIAVNPVEETAFHKFVHPQDPADLLSGGIGIADLFLQIKVNQDVSLLKAIIKLLWEREDQDPGSVFDLEFIQQKTEGFDQLRSHIQEANLESLIKASGVPNKLILEAVDLLARHQRIIFCWAMGLTQHENAVDNVKEIVNILLLKGSIGKPGSGTCPVRGHSNVQGDRTMGIWEKPDSSFLDRLENRFSIKAPRTHGYSTVRAIEAMSDGRARVFVSMGGNFISATPDSEFTAKAIQNCKLTVQVSTKLNRSHVITGEAALILPCISRSEIDVQRSGRQFVSVENSMGVIHKSQGTLKPASRHLLSEPAIIKGIATALFEDHRVNWSEMADDYDVIRDHIENVIPGFEDFNSRVRRASGFLLPNGPREGRFNTPSGKAQFSLAQPATDQLKDEEYIMMTLRSHDQFNTTIYDLHDRYRGVYNERRVVFMNPTDLQERHLKAYDRVNITSHYRQKSRTAENFQVVPFNIAPGCVASYFPEANVLVPIEKVAHSSDTPSSKSFVVTIAPVDPQSS